MWWHLTSPASRLLAQPFVQVQIKENIKAPRHWPLWVEFTGDFPAQRASNAQQMFSFDDVIMGKNEAGIQWDLLPICLVLAELLSFWRGLRSWLHWELSFWQFPLRSATIIASKWQFHRFFVLGNIISLSLSFFNVLLHGCFMYHYLVPLFTCIYVYSFIYLFIESQGLATLWY